MTLHFFVFLCSGTTWLGQIVSLLLATEDTYEKSKEMSLYDRLVYLEYEGINWKGISELASFPVPRAVKTHLPYRCIRRWIEEDNVKTIITTRNPKDTLVSLFHFYHAKTGEC